MCGRACHCIHWAHLHEWDFSIPPLPNDDLRSGPFVVIFITKLETSMLFGNTVPPSWGSTNIQKWHWCSYWCIKSRDHQWQFSCKKGVGHLTQLGDKSKKKGVIWHEIAQNPGNFNTFLILLENFDRKSNNWGSLGVKSCKIGRHSVKKKKKDAKKGVYCQADGIYRPMGVSPQALDLMKFIPI